LSKKKKSRGKNFKKNGRKKSPRTKKELNLSTHTSFFDEEDDEKKKKILKRYK
jgi:hypothetical protein